jgi:hypothetical protein
MANYHHLRVSNCARLKALLQARKAQVALTHDVSLIVVLEGAKRAYLKTGKATDAKLRGQKHDSIFTFG